MVSIMLLGVLGGCDRSDPPALTTDQQANGDQVPSGDQPLGKVTEFDNYTLRANVIRTESLPDTMARQYNIEADPTRVLLNLVILEHVPNQQPITVAGELTIHYESLVGHVGSIDMRSVEQDGFISYIGTLDASEQRFFRVFIGAQPNGSDESLEMNFEVELETRETR